MCTKGIFLCSLRNTSAITMLSDQYVGMAHLCFVYIEKVLDLENMMKIRAKTSVLFLYCIFLFSV